MHSETVRLFAGVLPRLIASFAILWWGGACARRAARARLGDAPWDVTFAAAAVLFALALLVPGLVLGAFGQLRDWTWALGALAAFTLLRTAKRNPDLVAGDDGPAPSAAFLIGLGGFTLGRVLYSLRNPPADWDSYHYHLPMVAAWIQSGALGVPMHSPAPFGQFFPGSGELLETWMAWSTGRDTLVTWVGIAGLGVLAMALRRLALQAGARPMIAEICALLTATAPGVTQLTLGAKVDHLLAAWFAIALVFALRYRRSRARADLAIVVCAIGLLPGVKSTGPIYAAMVLAVALLTRDVVVRLRALLACRAALAAAIFAGGFWYVRNALATGNPLYPAEMVVGGRKLIGLMSRDDLRRTMQLFVWLERGWNQGHLTVVNAVRYYGWGLAALALGLALWAAFELPGALRADASLPRRRARLCAALVAMCGVFFLFTPFSGVYLPAERAHALRLNFDNLRLLMPTGVVLLPLAAAGLSRLRPERALVLALAGLWCLGLGTRMSHIAPGIAFMAALWFARRSLRRWSETPGRPSWRLTRAGLALAAVVLLAMAVAWVDPQRERIEATAWNGFLARIPNLRWETMRKLRTESGGRPIAVTGTASWWALYGRDFSGHPAYVPLAIDWAASREPFHLTQEDRSQPDHERWLANLRASGARFAVISGVGDFCDAIPEQAWCTGDTTRFAALDAERCTVAYRIRDAAAAGAGGAAGAGTGSGSGEGAAPAGVATRTAGR